jgi:hypothetical protein
LRTHAIANTPQKKNRAQQKKKKMMDNSHEIDVKHNELPSGTPTLREKRLQLSTKGIPG